MVLNSKWTELPSKAPIYGIKVLPVLYFWNCAGSLLNTSEQNGLDKFAQAANYRPQWITEINKGSGSYSESGYDTQSNTLSLNIYEIFK